MATPFRPALDLLVQYAEYHRDKRNIATHFIGVPMIEFGAAVLLARPTFQIGTLVLTPAWVVFVLMALWYLTRGRLALGLVTTGVWAVVMLLAHQVNGGSTAQWLSWGVGFFVVGWVIQFIGHYYEGRKPAFADDLVGLLSAQMFLLVELLAPLGVFKGLMAEIEARVGPTLIRDLAHPAATR